MSLGRSEEPLDRAYDLAVLDLDGVVYIGEEAVAGAAEGLAAAREHGMRVAFVTNNASRRPEQVAERLRGLDVQADDEDVVSSAQATATLLADRLDAGAEVFVIGGEGLEVALRDRGLTPVTQAGPDVAAVAQGYGPDMPWKQAVAGAILVKQGLPWIASNTDMTIPTRDGVGPGGGTMVELVARFAEREPVVAGKPQPPLFEETLRRVGAERPLVVGDRLDTDIEGAVSVGWDSLLVLTGVTGLPELVAARPHERPTYLGADLAVLAESHAAPEQGDGGWELGGWSARVDDGALVVDGDGEVSDWWRVVAAVAWAHLDDAGDVARVDDVQPPVA